MNWYNYNRYETLVIATFLLLIYTFTAWVEAESMLADYQNLGTPLEPWKSYLWAISSHYVLISLIPLIVIFDRKFPVLGENWRKGLLAHGLFSVVFCLCHVGGMVLIRKVIHSYAGESYEFGSSANIIFYEYRKDLASYLSLLLYIHLYRFSITRLRGEAKVLSVGEGEVATEIQPAERFLVKKIGKEFVVEANEIEWIAASGNYMNLHVRDHVYPYRETMSSIEKLLDQSIFIRIHRSYIVNISHVKEIHPLESGDFKVKLISGKTLSLSRRYRNRVKSLLNS